MAELPPNRRAVVDEVYASAPYDLTTKGGCGCFTEQVAFVLNAREPGDWFHLKKRGGQNQWNGHAVDAVLYKTGYAVDIIGSSESPNAKPSWHVDKADDGGPRYANQPELYIVPTAGCVPGGGPTPGPDPEPPTPDPALEQRVARLEQTVAQQGAAIEILQRQLLELQIRYTVLEERVLVLEQAPPPPLPELVAEGTTGRIFGHAHGVRLAVKPA